MERPTATDITDQTRATEWIGHLYAVVTAFAEAITLEQVAKVAVEQGIAAVGASAGALALISDDESCLETLGSIGYPPEVIDRWRQFSFDDPTPLAEAFRRSEPVYIFSAEDRISKYPALTRLNAHRKTHSSACLPIIIGGKTIGTMGFSFDFDSDFPPQQRELLISFSRQCAQALDRAKLFDAERHALAEAQRAQEEMRDLLGKFERHSRLFERIASSTLDLIYVFDLHGRFLYANRRLLELWGKTSEEAIGKNLYELGYPGWHADMHMRELRQVIDTKQPIKGEVPFTGGSGISGVFEYIFTPVLGPDGEVEVIAGTTRDTSERKRAEDQRNRDEQALRQSEASFRQLADAMPQIVWAARPDGSLDYYNRRWFEFIGIAAEEVRDHATNPRISWNRYVHGDDFPRVAEHWANCLRSGEPYRTEFRVRNSDDVYCWFLVRAEPVRDAEGSIVRWFGTCTDITDRKRIEEERLALLEIERSARLEADRSSRMKDEFLATLSHELRTPLNAILGWAAILATGKPDDEELRDGLETIQRNARAQTQIIEDLLDMSRIINGKVRLEVQQIDLASVIRAALETVRPAAEAKGVRLRAVLDPNAGPVSGDSGRLQQVFWNLLNNAVKFTPRGGQVQVLLERVNSHLQASVADTGEGITPDFLPNVFDRFRQADATTTRRHGGLGLGLAIVKQLVELHGGAVRVASPGSGKGATFTVAIPITVLHAQDPDDQLDRRHPGAGNGSLSPQELNRRRLEGVRVIVVDDEPDARALVARLLERCGATVRAAASADETMALFAAETPDVLVSDIGMPNQDGYALIRRVRSLGLGRGGETPAVALTAYARTEDRIRAVQAGFQTHVVKPVEPIELITMVASLAGRTGE